MATEQPSLNSEVKSSFSQFLPLSDNQISASIASPSMEVFNPSKSEENYDIVMVIPQDLEIKTLEKYESAHDSMSHQLTSTSSALYKYACRYNDKKNEMKKNTHHNEEEQHDDGSLTTCESSFLKVQARRSGHSSGQGHADCTEAGMMNHSTDEESAHLMHNNRREHLPVCKDKEIRTHQLSNLTLYSVIRRKPPRRYCSKISSYSKDEIITQPTSTKKVSFSSPSEEHVICVSDFKHLSSMLTLGEKKGDVQGRSQETVAKRTCSISGKLALSYRKSHELKKKVNKEITSASGIIIDGKKRWKCSECSNIYTTRHNLITHMLGHRGIKPYQCLVCQKSFKQISHLETHLLIHSNVKPHTCNLCNKSFTQSSHIKRHMAIHMQKQPYVCIICNNGFPFPSELNSHMKLRHGGSTHECEHCLLKFNGGRELKEHLKSVHKNFQKLICMFCGKIFMYPSLLEQHVASRHNKGSRPFKCTDCDKAFTLEHHLKTHVLIHSGKRMHECEVCHHAFNQKANLKRHMSIHNNEKLFECTECKRKFSQKQTLKAHQLTHNKSKPFQCSSCDRQFGRLHNLRAHMHLHTESKPHICSCGTSFTLKGNLLRHKKTKHGIFFENEDVELEDGAEAVAASILNAMSGRLATLIK